MSKTSSRARRVGGSGLVAALALIASAGLASSPASASVTAPTGAVLSAYGWGQNSSGQNGDGTFDQHATAVQVNGLTTVKQVAQGQVFSAALLTDGTVDTWGYNGDGELGNGQISATYRLQPAPVPGLTGVVQIAAGYQHMLALKSDGTVWAWGYNGFRELGDGTTTDRPTPFQIPGLSGIAQVSASYYDSMARGTDGSVWAWGHNGFGELGDGTTTNRATPVKLSTLSGVTQISAGYEHGLAVKSDGTVWAWGNNAFGQLGIGNNVNHATPVQVPGLTGATQVAAGQTHSLAVAGSGNTVWAWGDDTSSGLGDGKTAEQKSPIDLFLNGISQISAGLNQSAAVSADGTMYLWGALNVPVNSTDIGPTPEPTVIQLPNTVGGVTETVQVSLGIGNGLAAGISAATVPSVVGDTRLQATTAIQAAGLTVGSVILQNDPTCAFLGKVAEQSPDGDTHVALGSVVNLWIGQQQTGISCP